MAELGLQRVPVLGRLAAGAAGRRAARPNQAGLDFYGRLVDELLAARHRALASRSTTGTCRRRSRTPAAGRPATPRAGSPTTPAWCTDALGDRVTLLDHASTSRGARRSSATAPACTRPAAPTGARRSRAAHHLLLAHGLAVQAIRAARTGSRGRHHRSTSTPVSAATDVHGGPGRRAPHRRPAEPLVPRPVLDGRYPEDVLADLRRRRRARPSCRTATWTSSARRSTSSGVNYYTRHTVVGGRAAADRRRATDATPAASRSSSPRRPAAHRHGLGGRPRRACTRCCAACTSRLRRRCRSTSPRTAPPTRRGRPTGAVHDAERIAYLRRPPAGRATARSRPACRCAATSSGR